MYDSNNKGAMWHKTAKTGTKYLGGSVEIDGKKYWIKCFNNTKKQSENQPDFNLVVDPVEQQQQAPPQQVPQQAQFQNAGIQTQEVKQDPWNDKQDDKFSF